jgi:hypothetical protein
VGLFLGLFALDAFEPGKSFVSALADFAVHLAPAVIVLAIVAMSWRRPWIGGAAFMLLAAAYAVMARSRPDWILVISGPLLIVAMLFLWSWRHQQPAVG